MGGSSAARLRAGRGGIEGYATAFSSRRWFEGAKSSGSAGRRAPNQAGRRPRRSRSRHWTLSVARGLLPATASLSSFARPCLGRRGVHHIREAHVWFRPFRKNSLELHRSSVSGGTLLLF